MWEGSGQSQRAQMATSKSFERKSPEPPQAEEHLESLSPRKVPQRVPTLDPGATSGTGSPCSTNPRNKMGRPLIRGRGRKLFARGPGRPPALSGPRQASTSPV